MPSLQDLLEDFDASRLEELAESLLADVTTDIEDDAAGGGHPITKVEGDTKSVLGPMVGSKTEDLEPCKDINGSLSTPVRRPKYMIKEEPIDCVLSSPASPNSPLGSPTHHTQIVVDYQSASSPGSPSDPCTPALNAYDNTMSPYTSPSTIPPSHIDITDHMYGTYDEESNCITILRDEDISNFEEVIEEVVCSDDDDEYLSQVSMLSPIPTNYPSPGYGSYYGTGADVKSPISTYTDRDSAYDSLMGSPPPPDHLLTASSPTHDEFHFDELWHDSFSELFPSLA